MLIWGWWAAIRMGVTTRWPALAYTPPGGLGPAGETVLRFTICVCGGLTTVTCWCGAWARTVITLGFVEPGCFIVVFTICTVPLCPMCVPTGRMWPGLLDCVILFIECSCFTSRLIIYGEFGALSFLLRCTLVGSCLTWYTIGCWWGLPFWEFFIGFCSDAILARLCIVWLAVLPDIAPRVTLWLLLVTQFAVTRLTVCMSLLAILFMYDPAFMIAFGTLVLIALLCWGPIMCTVCDVFGALFEMTALPLKALTVFTFTWWVPPALVKWESIELIPIICDPEVFTLTSEFMDEFSALLLCCDTTLWLAPTFVRFWENRGSEEALVLLVDVLSTWLLFTTLSDIVFGGSLLVGDANWDSKEPTNAFTAYSSISDDRKSSIESGSAISLARQILDWSWACANNGIVGLIETTCKKTTF